MQGVAMARAGVTREQLFETAEGSRRGDEPEPVGTDQRRHREDGEGDAPRHGRKRTWQWASSKRFSALRGRGAWPRCWTDRAAAGSLAGQLRAPLSTLRRGRRLLGLTGEKGLQGLDAATLADRLLTGLVSVHAGRPATWIATLRPDPGRSASPARLSSGTLAHLGPAPP